VDANFDKARFNNAVLDRVIFNGSSMKAADFTNGARLVWRLVVVGCLSPRLPAAVITSSEFVDVDLTDAIFEDALIGQEARFAFFWQAWPGSHAHLR